MGSFFQDQQPGMMMADPRTGYSKAQEARRIQTGDALAQQYAQAQADPNWGLGDPSGQKYQEQEIIDSVYNRLGAAGAGGSGAARAAAAKGLVDYRLGLLDKRAQAMNQLRQDMMATQNPAGAAQYAVTPTEGRESPAKGLSKAFMGSYLGGMGAALGGGGGKTTTTKSTFDWADPSAIDYSSTNVSRGGGFFT